MNTAVSRLFPLLVGLTLIGLLAWAGTDWYQLRQKYESRAQENLRQTAGVLTDQAIQKSLPESTALATIIRSQLLPDSRWKMLLLASPEGTQYYWGPRTLGDPAKDVPAWAPRFPRELSAAVQVYRPEGTTWTLQGVYEFYGTAEILTLLRTGGITLLILLVVTALLFMFQSLRRPEQVREEASAPGAPSFQPPLDNPEREDEKDDYWFDDTLTMEDLPPLQTPEGTESAPPLLANSGLGWSHFFEDRLTFELDRCSSDNQDLGLLVLGGKDLSNESVYSALAQEVRSYFPSHDLDFELRRDDAEPAVAVVLPNRSLETALKDAQVFLQRIDAILPTLNLAIGAAARSGRLLSASTLTKEATSALKRAAQSQARVLGLKTDPDRYREYLGRTAQGL